MVARFHERRRCLIPGFDSEILSLEWNEAPCRKRHDHARRLSSNTAIASFAHDAEPRVRDQPENSREMA